jgi:hypothetical protein
MDHIGINYVRFPADLVSEVIKLWPTQYDKFVQDTHVVFPLPVGPMIAFMPTLKIPLKWNKQQIKSMSMMFYRTFE